MINTMRTTTRAVFEDCCVGGRLSGLCECIIHLFMGGRLNGLVPGIIWADAIRVAARVWARCE